MKKRILIALAVALLLCLTATASLADSGARPFKGRVVGSIFTGTGIQGDPGGPLNLPQSSFMVQGPINATHLGKGTYTSWGWIDHPNGSLDLATGIYCAPLVPGTTTAKLVAANGDELYASLNGGFCRNLATGAGWGRFAGPFTGGTGRFDNATGAVVKQWVGRQVGTTAIIDSTWTGTIGY